MIEILAQIIGTKNGKSFTAGIVLWNDKVVEAAPIVRLMLKGRTRDQVRSICAGAGWKITVVHQLDRRRGHV